MSSDFHIKDVLFNKNISELSFQNLLACELIDDGTKIILSIKNGEIYVRTSGSFNKCQMHKKDRDGKELLISSRYDNVDGFYDIFMKLAEEMGFNFEKLQEESKKYPDNSYVFNFILDLANTPIPKGKDYKSKLVFHSGYEISMNLERLAKFKDYMNIIALLNDEESKTLEIKGKIIKKEDVIAEAFDFIDKNVISDVKTLSTIDTVSMFKNGGIVDIDIPEMYGFKSGITAEVAKKSIDDYISKLPYYIKGLKLIFTNGTYLEYLNPEYDKVLSYRKTGENEYGNTYYSICPDFERDNRNIWNLWVYLYNRDKFQDFYKCYDHELKYKTKFKDIAEKLDTYAYKIFSVYHKKFSKKEKVEMKPLLIPKVFVIDKVKVNSDDSEDLIEYKISNILDYIHYIFKHNKYNSENPDPDFKITKSYILNNFIIKEFIKNDNIRFGDIYGKVMTPEW